ncbi:hypothetical protein [Paenibacillus dokdonensis]|uniref:hypothetical protein n=1 Tax=Paenibacillus dokdonensis TaxID=2567944 RepID=UPI0010A8B83A|nr:hypothetical protein [Paenibacillus dokdonensis]
MPAKKKMSKKRSSAKWLGKPVLVVLKDGSYYVGTMSGIDQHGVTLSGFRADPKMTDAIMRSGDKAQVSGLLSSLFFGGSSRARAARPTRPGGVRAGGGNGGNGKGMFGFIGQMIPHIRIGMNVMRTIMPLMGGFFK